MTGKITMILGPHHQIEESTVEAFDVNTARRAKHFHSSFPEYAQTPLHKLDSLAKFLGVGQLYVKDESMRFGLNSFKGLGGSYAVGNIIAERLGHDLGELDYEKLISEEIQRKLGKLTFVSATDGNHGRGLAWAASKLKQRAIIYLPKGSAPERVENIRKLGAEASVTEWNYDDTVRMASRKAEENGWILTQDTAWEGYETIPLWIMQGYTTMGLEICEQLKGEKPTHIFLQAGVGAMAGAMTGFFSSMYGNDRNRPKIVIVEPEKAACLFRTARANDGCLHTVGGDLDSIMAGLNCGEPCTIGWNILKQYCDHFVVCPDHVAADGMRILGNPIGEDRRIISGESGAVTAGFLAEVMKNPEYAHIKDTLGLNEESRILCISTEGATDVENYRAVVWNGAYPNPSARCR